MRKTFSGIVLFGVVFWLSPSAYSDDAAVFRGAVSCGALHLNRVEGTEAHRSLYIMRNPNLSADLRLERLRFYTAEHVLAYDSQATGFPPASGLTLSAADRVLAPMQAAQYRLADVLEGNALARIERPGVILIEWTAARPVDPLEVSHVRMVRDRDPTTSTLGAERNRVHHQCRQLVPEE